MGEYAKVIGWGRQAHGKVVVAVAVVVVDDEDDDAAVAVTAAAAMVNLAKGTEIID